MYPLNRLLIVLLLLIPLQGSFAQDSIRFSVNEARVIALRLVELKECRELLSVTEQQYSVCDSLLDLKDMMFLSMESKLIYKDKLIDLQMKDNRALKRKTKGTVAIASVVVLVSLFIAIK